MYGSDPLEPTLGEDAARIRDMVPEVDVHRSQDLDPPDLHLLERDQELERVAVERYARLEAQAKAEGRDFEGWTSAQLSARLLAAG